MRRRLQLFLVLLIAVHLLAHPILHACWTLPLADAPHAVGVSADNPQSTSGANHCLACRGALAEFSLASASVAAPPPAPDVNAWDSDGEARPGSPLRASGRSPPMLG